MAIGALSLVHVSQLGKDYKENIGDITLDVTPGAANRVANAQKIDTFARNVIGLTNDTYKSVDVVYSYNIAEIIEEG